MSSTKLMEVPIDQNDAGVITKATGTAAVMTDIFVFRVPRSTVIKIRPEDTLSAYFKDASAEMLGTDSFELVVRDPNGYSSEVLCGGQYTTIKEFQDRNKTRKLGRSMLIGPDWLIALRAKATTILVNASCYFQISCCRYVKTL